MKENRKENIKYNSDCVKAIMLWRNKPLTKKNINIIKRSDIICTYQGFIYFSILFKNRNLEHYRKAYAEKTGKSWETATIQDIHNAELVWGY